MSRRLALGMGALACSFQLLPACSSAPASSSTSQGGTVSTSAGQAGRSGSTSSSSGGGAGGDTAGLAGGAGGLAVNPAGGVPNANGGASNGGASSAGSSSAGTSSAGSGMGGNAGAGGNSAGGGSAGSSGAGSSEPFSCTLLFGVSPTGQWFDGGFLDQVDASRWESIWVAHHYTNLWADPNDSGWSQALDPYPGPPHACAHNSTSPDRVVFVAVNWAYTTAAQWQTDLHKIVENLRQKYGSVRRIELMTLTRAPGNVVCAPGGSSSETIIPAWTDTAISATAAQYPGLVVAAPKFEVPKCADFMQNGLAPQYTDAGAREVAQLIGAYYAAHP